MDNRNTILNDFFIPGKLSFLLDASAGSSGKGVLESYICKNANNYTFTVNTFFHQASHIIHEADGKEYCYKNLNSNAHRHEEFQKMYIASGAVLNLESFFKELKISGCPREKIGISPLTAVTQEIDVQYEKGTHGFDGEELKEKHDGTMAAGSTCSGVGATYARKILRSPKQLLARDIPELQDMICDVSEEILARLKNGESGLCCIAQGWQLSYGLPRFYPHTTSRNCSVAKALDDILLPVTVVGNVFINLRTNPIRIASVKYVDKTTNEHLTWDQVQSGNHQYDEVRSYSGDGYPDQEEISWEAIEKDYGKEIEKEIKLTSLTKLPRRPFTFSKLNLDECIRHNQTPHKIFISVNFVNWLDRNIEGKTAVNDITAGVKVWLDTFIYPVTSSYPNVDLRVLGTGKRTDDRILIPSYLD